MSKPLICDNSLFASIAGRMARDTEVAYYSSWNSAFPTSREFAPGTGIKNVERVDDPIAYMLDGNASHVIVPDLYLNGLERLARELEIPTFGCNGGNRMETDRMFFYEYLAEHDLPVINTVEINGVDHLADYLADQKDKYVKVSVFRGDMESFHWVDSERSLPIINRLRVRFGPVGSKVRFLVQDPIPSVCEVGIDTYFNGKWLFPAILGWEIKDAGYAGYLIDDFPAPFQRTMDVMGGFFAQHDYRCFYSNEMRVMKDGTVYQTDATCRMPSPPSGVMMAACRNFTDVVLNDAPPDYGDAKFFCEIILTSTDIIKDYLQVEFPARFEERYAFHNYCKIDGKVWIMPNEAWSEADPPYVEFGSALGWGKTLEEASGMAEEAADAVKADHLSYGGNVLEKAKVEMGKSPVAFPRSQRAAAPPS